MKKYMESFYEESNMVHTGICGGSKLNIIISHSDLDGVTSAINLMMASKLLEEDFVVFLERTSRQEETSRILNEWLGFAKENPHKFFDYSEIEVMISDRMFVELDKVKPLDNMTFSWYDHHAGNFVSEDTIRESLGDKLKDYKIYTDIAWCGATITYISMFERLLNTKGNDTAFAFQDMLKEWSYAVNLWDTFQWKNIPELPEDKKTLGRKMGTVDKMMVSEKELYRCLDAILTLRNTLNHSEVWGWVDECYKNYQELCNVEYIKASENALMFNEEVVILEAEWKYASMIKEKWCEEHPETNVVITHHKSGGTVYSTTDYETPSFEIASFIGTSYGNNGGGHKHAAGFGCLELAVANWLDEDEMRAVVKDRIYRALKAFFNKGGN
jgi:hypothetical protein